MKRNDWILLITVLLYSLLFYKQSAGVNFLIFSGALVIGSAFIHKNAVRSLNWWMASLATVLTGFCVFWYGNTLSLVAHYISLLVLGAMSAYSRGSVLISMLLTFCSLGASLVFMVLDAIERRQKAAAAGKTSNRGAVRALIFVLVLVIVAIFFFMYRSSNLLFYEFTKDLNLDFISIGWIFFTIGGLLLVYGFYYHHSIPMLASWDASLPQKLQPRADGKQSWLDKLMSIGNERYSGLLLLGLLNLLLIFVNGVDIAFMLGDQELPEGVSYTEYLHQGVGMLITSIVLAMLIILYYFRGRLNFDDKSGILRALAVLWIAQNAFMLFSTACRNSGYIAEYGLTYKRIGVYVYLLLTLIGLSTVAVKVMAKRTNAFLFRTNAWLFFGVLAISPVVNWDRIITQYNLTMAKAPDTSYIANLSYANFEELAMLSRKGLPVEMHDRWDVIDATNRNFYREVYYFMYRQREKSWQSLCMNKRMVAEAVNKQPLGGDTLLFVERCDLEELYYFPAFAKIESIYALGNELRSLSHVGEFPELRELYVSNCALDSISGIEKAQKLEVLDIRGNRIDDLKPVLALKNLRTLHVSVRDYTQIEELKRRMPNLQIINGNETY